MKLIHFTSIDDPHNFKHPSDLVVSPNSILKLKKYENGSWLNGRWESKNTYTYKVVFTNGSDEEVDEITYNKIINELKNA